MEKILRISLILGILLISLIICNDTAVLAKKQVKVKKIILTLNTRTVRAGTKIKIRKTVLPKSALRKRSQWVTNNKAYAVADNKGNVKIKKAGAGKKVKITAKATDGSRKSGSIMLYILPAIKPKKPMVALTFDDGPKGKITEDIVKALKKYDAVATFFVIGSRLSNGENKKALRTAVKNGNEIGSHTLTHHDLTSYSAKRIQEELYKTASLVKRYSGATVSIMRPPFGIVNQRVKKAVNVPIIKWSIDTRDWQTLNADQTYRTVMSGVKDGSIILMHDCYEQTASATRKIISKLKQKGYQMVTVSELLKYRKISLEQGIYYGGIR